MLATQNTFTKHTHAHIDTDLPAHTHIHTLFPNEIHSNRINRILLNHVNQVAV